jgi:hypothetical protein
MPTILDVWNDLINDPITKELIKSAYSPYSIDPLNDVAVINAINTLISQKLALLKYELRKYLPEDLNDNDLKQLLIHLVKLDVLIFLATLADNKTLKENFMIERESEIKKIKNNFNIKDIKVDLI